MVSRSLPTFEHVNLQTAIEVWVGRPGRSVTLRGVVAPPHFGPVSLQQLVAAQGIPPIRLAAPPLVDLPNGPDSTLACLLSAVLLVEDARGRYVVMVTGPSEHNPGLAVEVAGLGVARAQSVLVELDALRRELNVYRGHVLDVSVSPMGGVVLAFAKPAHLHRDDVVLPDAVLTRIERHTLGIADHRDALLAAGQHLKRGLLLYGPPGTGKTHTMRYLLGRMTGYTRLVLTGQALHAIGSVADLARDLQPAVVVLEDVDLVAEDRSFGPGSSPVLFDLLDAMDGAAADADLLFILTTNRADLLEPALAARPGRVDVAVHIDLPDARARGTLFDLYARGITTDLSDTDREAIVQRTEGVTASFLKEFLRRAVLESIVEAAEDVEGAEPAAVTAAHANRALDDLLSDSQEVTRSLLGVGNDPTLLPPGGGAGALPPRRHRGFGWTAYAPFSGG
ncbi:MAG: hypothetical protein BGO26_15100 [Actinobacteria bacterium 69-20]|nr:ATP-binding protein [Actinomycetota bacterium]OJV29615.1 MAG: hypothetical protein BGO26_15100 [Actinobacteria bacterium 69-20]